MADPCATLEQQLSALEAELSALSEGFGEDLQGAAGSLKAGLVKQHKKELSDLQGQINSAKAKLEKCVSHRDVHVSGPGLDGLNDFDAAMQEFMHGNKVRAGQLTILNGGWLMLAHAYTFGGPTVTAGSLFRIASCSKAFTCAAIQQLYDEGKLAKTQPVFPLLGITKPAVTTDSPDANINAITVQELVDHAGGWNDHSTVVSSKDGTVVPGTHFDPLMHIRDIALQLGMTKAPGKKDVARYMYGKPLQFVPGTQNYNTTMNATGQSMAYSNFGYMLLGLVIEKVTNKKYIDYVRDDLLKPLGLDAHIFLSPMLSATTNPLEVSYDDPGTGPNALDPTSNTPVPNPYGGAGFVTKLMDSAGGIMTTATTLALFAHDRAVWGLGGRAPGATRTGGMPGTSSLMSSRKNSNADYAFIFNTWHFAKPGDQVAALQTQLENLFNTVQLPKPTFNLAVHPV
jgi:CubicO group peptidase (beta-lactamase class C family)